LRRFLRKLAQTSSKLERRLLILQELFKGDFAAALHLRARAAKRPHWAEAAKEWSLEAGLTEVLNPL
jgi:hypothetical protein